MLLEWKLYTIYTVDFEAPGSFGQWHGSVFTLKCNTVNLKRRGEYLSMMFLIFDLKLIGTFLEAYTVKMNMLYLINRIVATDYKQYY